MRHNTTPAERHAQRIAESRTAERRKVRAERAAAMRAAREFREKSREVR